MGRRPRAREEREFELTPLIDDMSGVILGLRSRDRTEFVLSILPVKASDVGRSLPTRGVARGRAEREQHRQRQREALRAAISE
jgi:hypothetical protein